MSDKILTSENYRKTLDAYPQQDYDCYERGVNCDARDETRAALINTFAVQTVKIDTLTARIAELESLAGVSAREHAAATLGDGYAPSDDMTVPLARALVELKSAATKFLHAHVPSDEEPYFIVDPQDVYDMDVALGKPGRGRIFKYTPDVT